jgi:hypothetical protein
MHTYISMERVSVLLRGCDSLSWLLTLCCCLS